MTDFLDKIKHKINMMFFRLFLKLVKMPTADTFIGTESSLQLCRTIPMHGVSHILIVTDAVLSQLGLIKNCIEELERVGVRVTIYDGIAPNPTDEQVTEGIRIAKQSACDGVLGFGGGSPMDAAKVIAAGVNSDKTVAEMEGFFRFKNPALPLFLIPTTAGTGSETTFVAVVSSTQEERKYLLGDARFVPLAMAIDHTLMVGIPANITAETGMDALTHAIESYISILASDRSRQASRIATKLIFNFLERAYKNGNDLEAREGMAYAAYQGGASLIASAGYVHGIAHQLGGIYHITHGLANAVVLPHILEYSKVEASKPLSELADVIGLDVAGKSEIEKAQLFIDAVKELSDSLNIPKHFEQIKEQDVARIYTQAQTESLAAYGVPKLLPRAEGEAIIRKIMA